MTSTVELGVLVLLSGRVVAEVVLQAILVRVSGGGKRVVFDPALS